jgi:hypothetical protein
MLISLCPVKNEMEVIWEEAAMVLIELPQSIYLKKLRNHKLNHTVDRTGKSSRFMTLYY